MDDAHCSSNVIELRYAQQSSLYRGVKVSVIPNRVVKTLFFREPAIDASGESTVAFQWSPSNQREISVMPSGWASKLSLMHPSKWVSILTFLKPCAAG